MEKRLNDAAIAGDIASLSQLLDGDALILDRVMVAPVAENPLHIAALLGHLDFAKEILRRKPELARELNSEGASPLHLASAKGYVQLVQELLKVNSDVCLVLDQDGRTPLHLAVVKGHLEVISELIKAKPQSAQVLTDGRETILHLCLQHNQFEAFKLLLQSVEDKDFSLKSKDKYGNTLLHLAVAKRQIQTVEFLLTEPRSYSVEVNAMNLNGVTALDALIQSPAKPCDMEIGEILRGAGGLRCRDMSQSPHNQIQLPPARRRRKKEVDGWLREYTNTLMIIAILVATVTFEAETDDSPKDYDIGYPRSGSIAVYANTVGFLSSLTIIVLILTGFPLRRRYLIWVLTVIMMIAITSVALAFLAYTSAFRTLNYLMVYWLGFMGMLIVWQLVRFVKWTKGRPQWRYMMWHLMKITVIAVSTAVLGLILGWGGLVSMVAFWGSVGSAWRLLEKRGLVSRRTRGLEEEEEEERLSRWRHFMEIMVIIVVMVGSQDYLGAIIIPALWLLLLFVKWTRGRPRRRYMMRHSIKIMGIVVTVVTAVILVILGWVELIGVIALWIVIGFVLIWDFVVFAILLLDKRGSLNRTTRGEEEDVRNSMEMV